MTARHKKSAPLGGDADSGCIVTYELVSNKCEASESGDLQILVLLSEPLCNSSLVTVAELELLVNQAVLLQELLNTTLGDVLDHRHLQLSLAFNLCITTIYTYRSRLKSRAIAKDSFEDDIKKISTY